MTTQLDLSKITDLETYLESTPFASSAIRTLPGGYANYTFQLTLKRPYNEHSTLILKHAKLLVLTADGAVQFGVERQRFEVEALRRLRSWLPQNSFVTVPEVHFFDETENIIIMDDCGSDSIATLKQYMLDGKATPAEVEKVCSAVGEFVGRVHKWDKTDASVLEFFKANEQAKTISAWATYGRLLDTLTGKSELDVLSDPPFFVTESELEDVQKAVEEATAAMMSAKDMFVMGDLWPGNVLLDLDGTNAVARVFIIDWELAKPGIAGIDLGQFCAGMHILGRFQDHCAALALQGISAFLRSYMRACETSKSDIKLSRTTLIHIGAHLVAWTPRILSGGKDATRAVVREGVELIVYGRSADDKWLAQSLVGILQMDEA